MPDPRSAMKEFRSLDAKRLAQGLSPDEEARWTQLRERAAGTRVSSLIPPFPPRAAF